MKKKRILFVYPSMIIGGSTTSLLSLMNCLDTEVYSIDLQLFRNEGPLIDALPEYVNLLPAAEKYTGIGGRVIKIIKCIFKGYLLKAVLSGFKSKKIGLCRSVLGDCKARELSQKNREHYDYAIGFLEGWSNRYLAWGVNANKKYAWLHSTFTNITSYPDAERTWMDRVDRIVFVADACRKDFVKTMPDMVKKAITVENITNSSLIRKMSDQIDYFDDFYNRFISFEHLKIVTVCRLQIKTKGLDRIVKCAQKLKKAGKVFLWYIIGDGEEREELINMIREANIEDVLVPIGKRINPYTFIKASNVMCMLSRYEGKPMIVTECMILGIPSIVTEYLSSHEQIKDGEEGFIVTNNDDTVADAAIRCIQDSDRLAQISNNLLQHEYGNSTYIYEIEEELLSL